MPMIESAVDLRSAESRANADAMRDLVQNLRATAEQVRLGGGTVARQGDRTTSDDAGGSPSHGAPTGAGRGQ